MEKPLLSLCMIVKNEEQVLKRCLESVQGLADEIIIVDTGSSDLTATIARQYTGHVYDFQWIDDFASARNYSLKFATGKWILVLDADEYIDEADKLQLRAFLEREFSDIPLVYQLKILNFTGESERSVSGILESTGGRLFPNHSGLVYKGPIHEQLTNSSGSIVLKTLPYRIYHTGYLTEVATRQNKIERNMNIFNKTLSSGKKLDAYEQFTLAQEYLNSKNYDKAIYYFKRAYDRAKKNDNWLPYCVDEMITAYLHLDRFKDALELVEQQRKHHPQVADYHCLSGMIFNHFGLYDAAAALFESCAQMADDAERNNKSFYLVKPDYGQRIPYQLLYQIYKVKEDYPKAVTYLIKLLQMNPYQGPLAIAACELLQRFDTSESIASLLAKLYPSGDTGASLFLLQTALIAGNADLSALYYAICSDMKLAVPLDYQLKYQFLMKNPKQFKKVFAEFANKDPESYEQNTVLAHAAQLAWGNQVDLFLQTNKDDIDRALQIAITLYHSGYADAYYTFVNEFDSDELWNRLGDYFLMNGSKDQAFEIYSLLLDSGRLGVTGLEYVGAHFIHLGETEDGLSLLQQAIDQNSPSIPLYTLFLQSCKEPAKKAFCREKLFHLYPQYRGIRFLSEL
jgi:glycosyltransferase involved in cell wall biosynthesis